MDNNGFSKMNKAAVTAKKRRGISGSTLKLIAIITMLIDHTAATILDRTLVARGMYNLDTGDAQAVENFFAENGALYFTDTLMRLIGRVSFPIFCFLLVEGFLHTKNIVKYAVRLGIFALVSEIPFDIGFYGDVFHMGHQNVFFTLLIGVLVMIGFKAIAEKARDKKWLPALAIAGVVAIGFALALFVRGFIEIIYVTMGELGYTSNFPSSTIFLILAFVFSIVALIIFVFMSKNKTLTIASIRFADVAVLTAGMLLADLLATDYSEFGILTIAVMYGLRKSHFKSMLGGCITLTVMSFMEIPAFFDLILIRFYNGKRGLNLKYVFYAFYPVHLLLLYLICYCMNIV
jgi:hypothetical protein